jgi:hypothetical protein
MKTIYGVYTQTALNSTQLGGKKRYTFNVEDDLPVGSHFKCDQYKTRIQVVEVLDRTFTWVDINSGKLDDSPGDMTNPVQIAVLTNISIVAPHAQELAKS